MTNEFRICLKFSLTTFSILIPIFFRFTYETKLKNGEYEV